MRPSRLVVFGVVIAMLAAAGAAYLATRPGRTTHPAGTTSSIVVPDALRPLGSSPTPDAAEVAAALAQRTRTPALGTLSAMVVDAATGASLYEQRAGAPMAPASTAKLLTAAALLTQLPATQTLTTGVVRAGNTLYLVGGGDVTLTAHRQPGYPATATLTDLATRTTAAVTDTTTLHLRYDAGGWSGGPLARGWSPGR